MDKKLLRKQYFIDPEVQSGLMKRLAIYWGASMLFITLPLAFVGMAVEPDKAFMHQVTDVYLTHWPILVMMLLFLPFALRDAIRFSNKFTGPIFRLRSELKRFEDGQGLRDFRFRKEDFWCDVAESMGHVSERIEELESKVAELESEIAAKNTESLATQTVNS